MSCIISNTSEYLNFQERGTKNYFAYEPEKQVLGLLKIFILVNYSGKKSIGKVQICISSQIHRLELES